MHLYLRPILIYEAFFVVELYCRIAGISKKHPELGIYAQIVQWQILRSFCLRNIPHFRKYVSA